MVDVLPPLFVVVPGDELDGGLDLIESDGLYRLLPSGIPELPEEGPVLGFGGMAGAVVLLLLLLGIEGVLVAGEIGVVKLPAGVDVLGVVVAGDVVVLGVVVLDDVPVVVEESVFVLLSGDFVSVLGETFLSVGVEWLEMMI